MDAIAKKRLKIHVKVRDNNKSSAKGSVSPSRLIVIDSENEDEEKVVLGHGEPLVVELLDDISDDGGDDELLYAPGDDLSASENDEDEKEADDIDNSVEVAFLVKKTKASSRHSLTVCSETEREIEKKFGAFGRVLSVLQVRKASEGNDAGLMVRMCGESGRLRQLTTVLAGETIAGLAVEICFKSGKFYQKLFFFRYLHILNFNCRCCLHGDVKLLLAKLLNSDFVKIYYFVPVSILFSAY